MASEYRPNFGVNAITATPLTARTDVHAGSVTLLDRAAGITTTLPAATGSGATYLFVVKTTASGGSYIIQVANASDVMTGTATLLADGGDTVVAFATAASSDTITLNGTTTGGIAGASVEVIDVATNLYWVRVLSDASGTEATPFS